MCGLLKMLFYFYVVRIELGSDNWKFIIWFDKIFKYVF